MRADRVVAGRSFAPKEEVLEGVAVSLCISGTTRHNREGAPRAGAATAARSGQALRQSRIRLP